MSELNEKKVKTRIVHKHDIPENWNRAQNFVPKQGELIIYDDRYKDEDGKEIIVANAVRYKIGDGTKTVNELPFVSKYNTANSDTALGINTKAGCRGYYFDAVCFVGDEYGTVLFALSKEQVVDSSAVRVLSFNEFSELMSDTEMDGLHHEYVDIERSSFNIVNNAKYYQCKCSTETGSYYWGHCLAVVNPGFTEIAEKAADDMDIDDFSITCPAQPDIGYSEIKKAAHAEGWLNVSSGDASHTEGHYNRAFGDYSHAEGWQTLAWNHGAHAEGKLTQSMAENAHAEGFESQALATASHAEGRSTVAKGYGSHAEGRSSQTGGNYESNPLTPAATTTNGYYAHAEGNATVAQGAGSHSEGRKTFASGQASHAEGNETTATNLYAHAEGSQSHATGEVAHAEGWGNTASNTGSHAEGRDNKASGYASHAEGRDNESKGNYSHTEGRSNTANGIHSHTEGTKTVTGGSYSSNTLTANTETSAGANAHAEGNATIAHGANSHAEGKKTFASGVTSHAEGDSTTASGLDAHSEGMGTLASGECTHAEGRGAQAIGNCSHAEGRDNIANGYASHTEGRNTVTGGNYESNTLIANTNTASGANAHAEGNATLATGPNSHSEGKKTFAKGTSSHAEGSEITLTYYEDNGGGKKNTTLSTTASGEGAHAEGLGTTASGKGAHAEGITGTFVGRLEDANNAPPSVYITIASGDGSHAEGAGTCASGKYAHAEGNITAAEGESSHTEGHDTLASGDYSHAEGEKTTASGRGAHAEGRETEARGMDAHAEGYYTLASGDYSHAQGSETIASGENSFAGGYKTQATGKNSFAIGAYVKGAGSELAEVDKGVIASGENSFAGGTAYYALISGGDTVTLPTNETNTEASGENSFAFGRGVTASGRNSTAFGSKTCASGGNSFAMGYGTNAQGGNSLAHGQESVASGLNSIALGTNSVASGENSFAGGTFHEAGGAVITNPTASGAGAFAYGQGVQALGENSHAEGFMTTAHMNANHAEGWRTVTGAKGFKINNVDVENKIYTLSSVDGLQVGQRVAVYVQYTEDSGAASITHVNTATNEVTVDLLPADIQQHMSDWNYWHAYLRVIGNPTIGDRYFGGAAHAEGEHAEAWGLDSHAEGYWSQAQGDVAHAEGHYTVAQGYASHAEGNKTYAIDSRSHAEGYQTIAAGPSAHAEGTLTIAGAPCNAIGVPTGEAIANIKQDWNYYAHAHAEGYKTKAIRQMAHAEGIATTASGIASHAGGNGSHAKGENAFAHGQNVRAFANNQFAVGQWNTENNNALFIVGNGTDEYDRHNAFEVLANGTAKVAGQNVVTESSTKLTNKVDKVSGKGLSTNDYTTAEKNKLAGIATGANKYVLPDIVNNSKVTSTGTTVAFTIDGKSFSQEVAIDGGSMSVESAGKLTAAKTIALSGDATGSVSFDGSDDVTLNVAVTDNSHNHASNTVNAMTGYSKPSSTSAIAATDTLNVAIGKLEKALDGKQASGSYALASTVSSHTGNTTVHITSAERTNWNAAKTHAESAHAPSGAQANVIETIKVNGTKLTPSSKAVDITVPVVDTALSSTSTNPVQNKVINTALANKMDKVTLATVATSGKYSDLSGRPTTMAPSAHNHASSDINVMTGYSKPSSTGSITATDTLNAAIGKLEKALDDKQASGSYAVTTTSITAGNGLTGGGNLSANRTLNVGQGNGITVNADTVAAKAGNGITVDSTGINHADTSSQASVTASGRRYITGVTLDTYGHVTGLTTGTETVTDTNTTYDLSAPASKTNGNVTLNLSAGGSGTGTDSVTIKGSGATQVTTDASGNIIISSPAITEAHLAWLVENVEKLTTERMTKLINLLDSIE